MKIEPLCKKDKSNGNADNDNNEDAVNVNVDDDSDDNLCSIPLMSELVGIFLNFEKSFLTMWSWDWLRAGSFFRLLASSSSFFRSDTFRNIN